MTIDPMAAVSSVTSGTGASAAGADPATSTGAAPAAQPGTEAPAPALDQGAKTDVFDYAAKQQNTPPAIETLKPEAQAKYLSNPTALGEKVLERLEGLHQRSADFHNQIHNGWGGDAGTTPSSGPAGSSDAAMSGPATEHVAGTATTAQPNTYSGLKMMFDYALESTMISKTSSQFVSSVNTLIKGQ